MAVQATERREGAANVTIIERVDDVRVEIPHKAPTWRLKLGVATLSLGVVLLLAQCLLPPVLPAILTTAMYLLGLLGVVSGAVNLLYDAFGKNVVAAKPGTLASRAFVFGLPIGGRRFALHRVRNLRFTRDYSETGKWVPSFTKPRERQAILFDHDDSPKVLLANIDEDTADQTITAITKRFPELAVRPGHKRDAE